MPQIKKRKKKPLTAREKKILADRDKKDIKEGTVMGAMQGGFAGMSAYQGEKFDSRGNKKRATGTIGGAIVGGLLGRRAVKKRIKKEKEMSESMDR